MNCKGAWRVAATFSAALILTATSAWSVDVEKKLRVSLQVGGYNTEDEAVSDASNRLVFIDDNNQIEGILSDPRNDSGAFGAFGIEAAQRAMASVQYAVNKIFILEAAVGYQKGDVGDVEVQAQYSGVEVPDNLVFLFDFRRFAAGEMEQVPLQLSAMARFRPRANFNPFIGGGVGYTFVGFKSSDELSTLSQRMDASTGAFLPLLDSFGGFDTPGPLQNLSGAEVVAPDYFEWHLLGGAEYSIKRRWALYADVRYVFASREFQIRFNGDESLGIPVPQGRIRSSEAAANPEQYGPIQIQQGGLLDGGRLTANEPVPAGMTEAEYCSSGGDCTFVNEPDGEVDPGLYYAKGGRIKYGGWTAAIGVRFTF